MGERPWYIPAACRGRRHDDEAPCGSEQLTGGTRSHRDDEHRRGRARARCDDREDRAATELVEPHHSDEPGHHDGPGGEREVPTGDGHPISGRGSLDQWLVRAQGGCDGDSGQSDRCREPRLRAEDRAAGRAPNGGQDQQCAEGEGGDQERDAQSRPVGEGVHGFDQADAGESGGPDRGDTGEHPDQRVANAAMHGRRSCAEGDEARGLDGIPGPVAAPADLGVSPPGAGHEPGAEQGERRGDRTRPCGRAPAAEAGSGGEDRRVQQAGQACVEQRWVPEHRRMFEHRLQPESTDGGHRASVEGVRLDCDHEAVRTGAEPGDADRPGVRGAVARREPGDGRHHRGPECERTLGACPQAADAVPRAGVGPGVIGDVLELPALAGEGGRQENDGGPGRAGGCEEEAAGSADPPGDSDAGQREQRCRARRQLPECHRRMLVPR